MSEPRKSIDIDSDAMRERNLTERVQWFFREYAEQIDIETRSRFEADLFMLIRATHADAAHQFSLMAGNVNRLCEYALALNHIIKPPMAKP